MTTRCDDTGTRHITIATSYSSEDFVSSCATQCIGSHRQIPTSCVALCSPANWVRGVHEDLVAESWVDAWSQCSSWMVAIAVCVCVSEWCSIGVDAVVTRRCQCVCLSRGHQ